MTETVSLAVPRKGRPLEAVLERLAARTGTHELADSIVSTLRYEKAIAKGAQTAEEDVYGRLAAYSTLSDETQPDYTLVRDDRSGKPRRIVFDSVTIPFDGTELRLIGREEPFRALRKHEFAFGFDSADLVLEEVVELRPEPLRGIEDLNARINPHDTDVRVVTGLGDTVYHTLMGTPKTKQAGPTDELSREFVADYGDAICISPRYERLVEAVLGTRITDSLTFHYPNGKEEEAAIAETGLGVYLTVTGSTARNHGLELGEELFPSETVLMENLSESTATVTDTVKELFRDVQTETELAV